MRKLRWVQVSLLALLLCAVHGSAVAKKAASRSKQGAKTQAGRKTPRSFYEKTGGFSYTPPAGWKVVEYPGLKYRICTGPPKDGFAPNIVVVDEKAHMSLASYLDESEKTVGRVLPEARISRRESFRTEDGAAGFRWVLEQDFQGRSLRQPQYFFEKGDRKYSITCSALAAGGEALDPVFAKSMKTFRLHD